MSADQNGDEFAALFAFEKRQFVLTGLYPLRASPPIGYGLRRGAIFLFSALLPASMIVQLLIGVESLAEFADILYYLTTQFAYICKLGNFVYGPGRLLRLEDHLRRRVSRKFYDAHGRADLHRLIRQCDALATLYRVLIVGIVGLYAVFPYLDANKQLPFAGWLPVDVAVCKWPVYATQVLCVFVSAFTNGNLDLLTVYLLSIGVAKLRLLKACFRRVDYARPGGGRELGELYALHAYVVEYLAMVEELFSNGIFVQFLASIAVVCMTGFQIMITPPRSGQFVLLILYINCMMCQVVMYCWYGNEILFESDGLADACYMSNWYEGTSADKKFLFIVMERSKRQLRMTAGKFFTLSLPTLVMILKSSYSYFAVLQRLYADD